MAKYRHDRWDYREYLKWGANRAGIRALEHPQVRRQVDEADSQEDDVSRDFAVAQQNVADAIKAGTVTADDFRGLGEAYGDYIKSRVAR